MTIDELKALNKIIITLPEEQRQDARTAVKACPCYDDALEVLKAYAPTTQTDARTPSASATRRAPKTSAGASIKPGNAPRASKARKPRKASKPSDTLEASTPSVNTSKEYPDKLERVQGETIPNDKSFDIDEIKDIIDTAISNYCLLHDIDGETGLKKEEPQTWAAVCSYIGKTVFKGKGYYTSEENASAYNPKQLEKLLQLFVDYCAIYNKPVTVKNYAAFAGITRKYIYEATAASGDILQKVIKAREETAEDFALSKTANLTRMAWLNNIIGWSSPAQRQETKPTAVSYPVLTVDINGNKQLVFNNGMSEKL